MSERYQEPSSDKQENQPEQTDFLDETPELENFKGLGQVDQDELRRAIEEARK